MHGKSQAQESQAGAGVRLVRHIHAFCLVLHRAEGAGDISDFFKSNVTTTMISILGTLHFFAQAFSNEGDDSPNFIGESAGARM